MVSESIEGGCSYCQFCPWLESEHSPIQHFSFSRSRVRLKNSCHLSVLLHFVQCDELTTDVSGAISEIYPFDMDSDGDIDSAPVSTDANADGAGITLGMGMGTL